MNFKTVFVSKRGDSSQRLDADQSQNPHERTRPRRLEATYPRCSTQSPQTAGKSDAPECRRLPHAASARSPVFPESKRRGEPSNSTSTGSGRNVTATSGTLRASASFFALAASLWVALMKTVKDTKYAHARLPVAVRTQCIKVSVTGQRSRQMTLAPKWFSYASPSFTCVLTTRYLA